MSILKRVVVLSLLAGGLIGVTPQASAEGSLPLLKDGAPQTPEQGVIDDMVRRLVEQNRDSLVLQSAVELADKLRGLGYVTQPEMLVVRNPNFDPMHVQPEDLAKAKDMQDIPLRPYLSITDFFGRMLGDPTPKSLFAFWRTGEVIVVGRLEKSDWIQDGSGHGPYMRVKTVLFRITATFESPGGRSVPFDSLNYKLKSVSIEESEDKVIPQGGASTAGG